jgi:hypothetical protein
VAPSLVPEVEARPAVVSFDDPLTLQVRGVTDEREVTLERLPGDPDDPTDGRPDPAHTHSTGPWRLAEAPTPGGFSVHLPNGELAPGPRAVVVTNLAGGLPAGRGHAMVTVVPVVVSAATPLQAGGTATLTVRHVVGPGRVFVGGTGVAYTVAGPSSVSVVVPALPPGLTVPVSIRCGTVSGPATDLAVGP